MFRSHCVASRSLPQQVSRSTLSPATGNRVIKRKCLLVRAVAEPPVKDTSSAAEAAPKTNPLTSRDDLSLSEVNLKNLIQDIEAPVAAPPKPAVKPLTPAPDIQWPPKRPFAAIALDNALDSAVDIMRHIWRMNLPLPTASALERLVNKGSGPMRLEPTKKPVVLVLGSGWGAHSLSKVMDTDTFDVVAVSPRNHFVFTPMLPSTAVGTVEFRSLLEPVRISNPFVTYFEASCDAIDLANKTALCTSAFVFEDGRQPSFEVKYDMLVVAVGEQPATFGVPGVRENCHFMKEVTDCVDLRMQIGRRFEVCNLPGTSDEDRSKNLHFVVVGGGPTGVEFAGTLADFVREDLKKKYPELMKYVKVTLLQSAQSILTTFQESLQSRALDNLRSTGVEVRLGVRVVEITADEVILKDGDRLPYGVCVWSAGNSARPLVRDLVAALPEQAPYQRSTNPTAAKLAVDPFLRVIGASDVFAIGDCCAVVGNRLPTTAQVAAQQGSYLAHLINKNYDNGVGGMFEAPPSRLSTAVPIPPIPDNLQPLKAFFMGGKERAEIGSEVSAQLAALEEPPWAEAARAAQSVSKGPRETGLAAAGSTGVATAQTSGNVEFHTRPFEFLSLGIMAYVGNDKALTQLEAFDFGVSLYGSVAFLLWRSVYITKQVSFRNRVLILFDWVKAQVFGRDLSLF